MTLLDFLSSTLSTASVRWTYFVVDILVDRRPASAGLALVDLVVDGQRLLDLLRRHRCRQPASAGLVFVDIVVDGQRPLDLLRSQPPC